MLILCDVLRECMRSSDFGSALDLCRPLIAFIFDCYCKLFYSIKHFWLEIFRYSYFSFYSSNNNSNVSQDLVILWNLIPFTLIAWNIQLLSSKGWPVQSAWWVIIMLLYVHCNALTWLKKKKKLRVWHQWKFYWYVALNFWLLPQMRIKVKKIKCHCHVTVTCHSGYATSLQ